MIDSILRKIGGFQLHTLDWVAPILMVALGPIIRLNNDGAGRALSLLSSDDYGYNFPSIGRIADKAALGSHAIAALTNSDQDAISGVHPVHRLNCAIAC